MGLDLVYIDRQTSLDKEEKEGLLIGSYEALLLFARS
jgi:hypothetical protein